MEIVLIEMTSKVLFKFENLFALDTANLPTLDR